MSNHSIKIKITLWFTTIMVFIAAIVFGMILSVSENVLVQETKGQLVNVVEENLGELEYDDGMLEVDSDFVFQKHGVVVYVYEEDGELLAGDENASAIPEAPFRQRSVHEAEINGVQYLLYDVQEQVEDYGRVWLRGSLRKEDAFQNGALNTVLKNAVFAIPLLILLAAVGGFCLTSYFFRPLGKISDAAKSIGDGKDLSLRIGLGVGKDEFHRLGNQFDQMFERLEQAFLEQKQFTSDASHELRTPITVILAQCEYALEEERDSGEYKEALEVIERQSFRMSKLVKQLLVFARMERGTYPVQKERTDVSALVSMICSEMADLRTNGITLQTQIEPKVEAMADRDLITRLLTNLIGNAFRYGKEQGNIFVSLTKDGNTLQLAVSDDGIGIAEKEMTQIWKRFYRCDSSRSQDEGDAMGLGLSMVKQIAELHDGNIEVESILGNGSKFIFKMFCF